MPRDSDVLACELFFFIRCRTARHQDIVSLSPRVNTCRQRVNQTAASLSHQFPALQLPSKMADDKEAAVKDTPTPSQSVIVEFHDGTEEGKKAFLASFSAAEDKAIMRKVDRRFLVLIGLIYVIKNVCGFHFISPTTGAA